MHPGMKLVQAAVGYKIWRWMNGGQYPKVQVAYVLDSRDKPNTSEGK